MTTVPYPLNFVVPLESVATLNKSPIANADIKCTVRRQADDLYWTGTGTTFESTATLISLTEISETNSLGWWRKLFNTNTLPPGTYTVTYTDASGNADNYPQYNEAIVGEGVVLLSEIAAAGVLAKVKYDEVGSIITLRRWDDPNVTLQIFDAKDKDGNPALLNKILEKIPQ